MNKIFRIVWSQATQSWVAVSELTKAHKKQSSSNSQGSAVKFSGNFIKSSAIALALLSGHSAYAAVNAQGTGSGDSVAWGTSSDASGNNAVAVGKESKATQNNAVAVGRKAQATGDSAIAVGIDSQASGTLAEAIGVGSKAIGNKSVAISTSSKAEGDRAIAIGDNSNTNGADTIALGTNSKATSFNTVALGRSTQASGQRSMAFGNEAKATANDTIAFGSSSEAKKNNDIIIGKEAKSRDEGGGHSVAVGYNATAGSSKTGAATDVTRTGTNEAAGGVAIGVSSYTGLNRNNTAINSSVAIGAGAGAGYRAIGADGLPTGNGTDPDDNATVLVKAFGGTKATLSNFNNSGTAAKDGFFSFQGVDINEGTALGRNTRAIGDQSVAIGAQSIAGMGSIVIGGNDIQAYDGKNYFKAANPTSGPANTVNDYDAPTTPGTGKNGQPITISKKYEELVGAGLDRSYRASYGQDGSTVIGMQAHSTTPLGVAIGTNSIVRKGAFGSTAIGSGASILANAEAAVAIGMGAEAQGNYAVAAGTAARAKESAVAVGYQANAVESSVAVGHEAKSTKESDIAVGKGAIASGNQGAIAMGLGTNAQGDSSIMIGGSNISSAANQRTEFEKATGGITAKSVTEKINGKDVTRNYTFAETTTTPGTIAEAYKELTGLDMDVSTLDFADAKNKNGHASTSLGVHALSKGNLATAIGAGARADAIGSLALGTGAHATKQNAVAIGTGSTTALVGTRQLSVNYDSDGNIVSDNDKDKIAYTFKWAGGTNTSEGDVVSFGSSGAERQLKNVAAGRVAEDSTDAINGSQLNSITKKIAAGFNTSGNVVTGSSGEFTSKQKNANVDSAKKDYETAIRSEDKVQFQVGNNLKLDRDETEVEVEVPDDFNKNQKVKKKIRKADFAYSLNPVSKGNLATAIGAGARADAIGSLALGTGAHATKQNAVAIGTGSTTALVGTRQLSVNYDSDGNIVSDNDKDKIAYTFKWAGGTNTSEGDVVSFGSSGAERQLKNVAAGRVAEDSTDAINGSQLNSITKKIAAGFNTSGNVVTGSSGEFTSKQKNANVDSAKKDYETAIRSEDKVQFQVGNNLKLDRDETEVEVEVPDDFNKNQKVKKKIRKADFAYSLNPVLTNLTSAEFKGSDTAPTTKLTNAGVTITPVTAGKSPVSLTENGLNNGGNAITDVAGNLEGAKTGTTEPKNKADKPNNVDDIKNNAATVGDVLNAGWNLQGNTTAKDFVTAYDTVNFVDGDGTTVSVENTDGKTSKIKYSVNTGNGLQKDPTGNTISVKPADKSLEVTNEGVKVKAADNTLTTDDKGLKVNTGEIEPVTTGTNPGTVKVKDNDAGKIATVDSVVKAVNSAAWIATSDKTTAGELGATPTDQSVKAGDKVTFEADKNIKITQAGSKFTFTTKNDVSFNTVQVGGEQGPKLSKTDEGDFKVSGSNGTDPVKVTNVKSGLDTYGGNVPGTTAKNTGLVDLSKPTTGEPKVSDNTAATVGDLRNMGWIVSSDKTTGADGAVTAAEYSDKVKNANEVKFVGKNAAKVSGKTDPTTGIRTITVDVAEPDVKTAELVSSKDGSVIAPSTNPDLQKALKNAKDELAAAATPEQKEAAKNKVKAAETALNNALDNKGVATAKNVADMINNSGFTLKTSKVEGGEKDATSTGDEVINPGKAVEMVAGKNLTVKQEANGKVTYATKDEVEFNTVKVGNPNTYVDNNGEPLVKVGDNYYKPEQLENGKPKNGEMPVDPATVKNQVAPVNMKTEAATPANNNVGKDGNSTQPTTALNFTSGEGDNAKPTQLKGVGSVLSTKEQPTSTGKQGDTPATAGNQNLVNLGNNPITGKSDLAPEILNSAATVGDLANMGWVVSTKDGNGYKDVVKNANQVDFVGKNGITVTGETKDGIRTITVETAQSPVVYTDKEGNKLVKAGDNFYPADSVVFGDKAYPADSVVIDGNVYPAGTTADDVKAGTATPATALTNGKKPADVIASMNNGDDKSANAPMQLGNVAQGAETIAPVDADGNKLVKANDGKYYPAGKVKADGSLEDGTTEADAKQPLKLANDGKWYPADQISAKGVPAENAKAVTPPATMDPKAGLVDFANSNPNNAATVGDLQNMGWIVGAPANGYTDQVRNANKVNFVGKGIATVTGETDAEGVRTITVNVANGLVDVAKNETDTATGAVTGPKKAAEDALKAAKAKLDELNNNPTATEEEKKAAQDAVNKAQNAFDNAGNLVATAQNVADMINNSGFTLKADKTEGDNLTAADLANGEMINPGDTITMKAGKNMSVKHEKDGSITYATKDEVEFNTVKVGNPNTYVDNNGEPLVKVGDNYYKPEQLENGKPKNGEMPVDPATVKNQVAPVNMKTEAATPANNNVGKDGNSTQPTTALNFTSGEGDNAKPTQLKGVGSVLSTKEQPTSTGKQGDTPATAGNQNLVNLGNNPITGKSDLAPEILNSAATVGDLANMGWVVSTKDGNGYKDVVKNANQVDFVGKNGITVTGETKDGIRTITVETAQSPVVYTDKEGNKLVKAGDNFYPADSVVFGDKAYPADSVVIDGNVYPAGTTADDVKAGTATPATALTNGKKPADVIASMNNGDDKSANAPMQLGNVAQGAETIAPVDADGNKLVKANDGKYYPAGKVKADGSLEDGTTEADAKQPLKLANDGKWYPADQISAKGVPAENAKAVTPPATMDPKAGLVDFANSNPNNAATVGDLQNMGWIVGAPANGYTDQVRNANKVNFVGKGIATVTGETDAEGVRTITVNVANGLVDVAKNETDTATGAVTGPKKAAEDALKAAKAKLDELNNNPTATEEEKKAAQDAVNKAQNAFDNAGNLVATAQNVADMINKSGFNLKTSAAEGQKVKGTKDEGELINPGATVEMVAGKNMSVKQDENGKVTYATKDDVSFNTVNVGEPETYKNAAGETVVKGNDGKFYKPNELNADGKPNEGATGLERDKVTVENPQVTLKREAAKEATNNDNANKPSSALNVSSSDGKPTQLKGVGSVLDATAVPTAPEGTKDGKTATPEAEQPKLVNLEGKKDPKTGKVEPLSDETLNSAATVRDIANMGWVVSTKDGNGYKDVVKNANQVDFKGGAGISVKGETTKDGVREITISVKDGEVIKPNQFTAKVNGTDTPVTKVGDQYYNTADIDPKTGKPNAKANPVTPDAGTTPTNAGDGYVTGNKVATAIQKSGFVVGKQTETLSAADFNDKDEKVNPDDELRFADGNNTKVKLATKESVDKDGNKVTTTTVKVDVTGLPVQYTAKVNGKDTPVTKVGDKYFTVDDKGNPTATEVNPTDLTTNMVNPAAAPNVIGAPTALGNVKSNLPSVNDADKNAKDVAGNPIAGKDNKSAPITATEAADLLNPKTADGKANPKFAGNNAATVSDVLNTGWNLQNNGEAKDFVKPYDTVNFVDGKGTKAVVETTPNGTTSNVKFDIDTGSITNNANGSVQGPVTPEMQKALEDATNALNSLPPTAPAAVIDAAKKAVADAANNIANVANKVATAQDVANAINKSGFALTTSANGGEKISGTPEMINPGKKVEMVAGKNMTVKQESNGKVTYATASNVTFDSVQFGDKGPKITNKAGNINVSGPDGKTPTKITGVAPGEISATSKDAINGSQLHAVASNLNNKINKVGKHADAGTASALAAANIPQAYTPGKSLVGIAAGNYQGQNGLAVGMSRISDNGKIIIRLSGTANSQGKTGVAAGVGYQW